jgi:hypothetical protein
MDVVKVDENSGGTKPKASQVSHAQHLHLTIDKIGFVK